jgi:hypothetical protein
MPMAPRILEIRRPRSVVAMMAVLNVIDGILR